MENQVIVCILGLFQNPSVKTIMSLSQLDLSSLNYPYHYTKICAYHYLLVFDSKSQNFVSK